MTVVGERLKSPPAEVKREGTEGAMGQFLRG
jgi:hypothetical protein